MASRRRYHHYLLAAFVSSFLFLVSAGYFIQFESAQAAVITWDGGGTDGTCGGGVGDGNKWSCGANWSTNVAPTSSDTATFNGTSTKDATIDTAFTIIGLNINAGYTGTITQAASLTISTGSSFTHNTTDGKFQWTAGTLSFVGSSSTWDVDTGDDTFGDVTISKTGNNNVVVTSGDTAVVTGTLTLTDGNINTGIIEARGDVVHGAAFDGGNGTLNITQGVTDISLTDGGQLPTVNLSATRNMLGNASGTVTFDGNFAISGGAFVGGAGNLDFNGTSTTLSVSIVSPATFTAPSGTMFINGGYSHVDASTFTHNSGTVTFDGPSTSINVNTTETFNNITWNATSGFIKTVSTGDTIIALGTLTLNDGNIGTGTVDARGDVIHTATFDGGTGTIAITAGSTPINLIAGGQLPHVNLSASRTINGAASGTVTFDNTFTLSNGSFVGGAGNIDTNGAVTLSNLGTFTAPSGTWFANEDWAHTDASVFSHNSGTIVFDGNLGINVNVTETFFNVTINSSNGPSVAGGDTAIVAGLLTLTNGTLQGLFQANGNVVQDATFDGGVNSGIVSFGDDATAQTYTVNGGVGPTVLFNDPDDANDSLIFNAAATMGNIQVLTGFTGDVPLVNTGDFVLTFSNWLQQAGSYDASAQSQWNLNDFDGTGGTFIAPVLTAFVGGGNVNVALTANPYFNNVTINKTDGTDFQIPSGQNLTVHGDLSLIDGGFHSNNNLGKGIVEGNVTIASTLDSDNALLEFSGSGNQTFDLTGATSVFNADIRVDKTGGSVSLISSLVLDATSQDLIIIEGTFDLSGQSLTVNGVSGGFSVQDGGVLERYGSETMTLNAGQPTLATDSTVRYTGNGDAVADTYTVTTLATTYGDLEIASTDGATDTFQLGAAVVTNGDFDLVSGTFDVTASNRSMLVHGDWNNAGTGIFVPRAGTVTLNGPDHTITGSTTFFDFTDTTSPATLTFPANLTQTFTGTLTLAGSSTSSRLNLRSSIPGTKAKIDPQGPRVFQFLSVQDNDNDNVIVADCTNGCLNSGNNENWFFGISGGGGGVVTPTNLSITLVACSASRTIDVVLAASNTKDYILSEDSNFTGAVWTVFVPQSGNTMTVPLTLSAGDESKTIYVKFRSSSGNQSGVYQIDVVLDEGGQCTVLPEPEPEPETPPADRSTFLTYATGCNDTTSPENGLIKAGSTLVKFPDDSKVYVVENDPLNQDGRILRWIVDEDVAIANFGKRWNWYVLQIEPENPNYQFGEPLSIKEYSGNVVGMRSRAALNQNVTYDISIILPDGTQLSGASGSARVTTDNEGISTYSFEDNVDNDFNDVVLKVDPTNCLSIDVTALPLDANLHSQIWLTIYWEGVKQGNVLVFNDSQLAVTHIATVNVSNELLFSELSIRAKKNVYVKNMIK